MLESQRRDDCRVLRIGLGGRPDLRAVDKHLCNPSILKPADGAGASNLELAVPFRVHLSAKLPLDE